MAHLLHTWSCILSNPFPAGLPGTYLIAHQTPRDAPARTLLHKLATTLRLCRKCMTPLTCCSSCVLCCSNACLAVCSATSSWPPCSKALACAASCKPEPPKYDRARFSSPVAAVLPAVGQGGTAQRETLPTRMQMVIAHSSKIYGPLSTLLPNSARMAQGAGMQGCTCQEDGASTGASMASKHISSTCY